MKKFWKYKKNIEIHTRNSKNVEIYTSAFEFRNRLLKKKTHDHFKNLIIRSNYFHRNKLKTIFEFRRNKKEKIIQIWKNRYNKQITNIYWTTFYFDSINQHVQTIAIEQKIVLRFFKQHIENENAYRKVRRHFFHFKSQIHNDIWIEKIDFEMFWSMIMIISIVNKLVTLTKRIFSISINFVSSKRAFSIMNFIYIKHRNRLIVVRVDMLQFIFMNDIIFFKNKHSISLQNMLFLNSNDEINFENLNMQNETIIFDKRKRETNEFDDDVDENIIVIEMFNDKFVTNFWLTTTIKFIEMLNEI